MIYNIHMKRTNLVLDEEVLEKAVRVLGAKTYSEAVNRALEEAIRLYQVRGLTSLAGTDLWQGDLGEMREDRKKKKKA